MILETIAGALTGLLGTALTTYSNYKMRQLEADNKIRLIEAESAQMRAEAEASIKVAQTTSTLKIEEQEAHAFTASMNAQSKALPSEWLASLMGQKGWARLLTYPIAVLLLLLMGLGDVINHLMRPALTLYTLAIASWVTYQCWGLLPPADQLVHAWQGWKDACDMIMLLAVTMVTWWFGDRRVAKHLMHMKESGYGK